MFVGKKIREAREEMKLSQSSLAKTIYRRQATLSDFENGKSSIDVSTLIMISAALKKPLSYFLPDWFNSEIEKGSLSPEEQELIIQYRRIYSDQNSIIALNQIKALADLDEKQGNIALGKTIK